MQHHFTCKFSSRRDRSISADGTQSLAIALLRGLAAIQVALSHLRAETFPSLREMSNPPLAYQAFAFATGFAHQAVVVFFLVSGWLVGGSLLSKFLHPKSLKSYAIDRISRLWTVMIPTFFLMLLSARYMDHISMASSNLDLENEYAGITFIGNLFGLQTIVVPNFGGNYALWSLANETWYYVLFPLLLLAVLGKSAGSKGASILAIAAIVSFLPSAMLMYFSLWLLGACFSRLQIECSNITRCSILIICLVISVYYRLTGSNADLIVESYFQDLFCSIPLLFLLATLVQPLPIQYIATRYIRSVAKILSEISFTLYVTHVPILALIRHIRRIHFKSDKLSALMTFDYVIYLGIACILVMASFIIYWCFEKNTFLVRRYMKKKLLYRQPNKSEIVADFMK